MLNPKKLVGVFLLIFAISVLFPTAIFAEGNSVITIGDTAYETTEAVAAALPDYFEAQGDVLRLIKDYTLPAAAEVIVKGNIELDLNGCTLTLADDVRYGLTVSIG